MMLFIDNKKIKDIFLFSLANFQVFLLIGCYSRQELRPLSVNKQTLAAYLSDKPQYLQPFYSKIITEGKRNEVLNYMQLGVEAMEKGYYEDAEFAFDKALAKIESIYPNNENTAKAKSVHHEEEIKDFKGEPYERCMAYYYRGLLYLIDGDLQNARACFKMGVFQDALAEDEQYRCDFALMIFLEGLVSQYLGNTKLAEEAYKELKKLRPDFILPSNSDNVLVIVETGTSPRKVTDGPGHSELKFRRGRNFTEKRVTINLDNFTYYLYPIEDIAWQAMTRGGRAIDKILAKKVYYREHNKEVGTVLTEVSSNAMISAPLWGDNVEAVQEVSAAIGLVGVVHMANAANAHPHADTRFWNNLPDAVHVFTLESTSQKISLQIDFLDGNNNRLPDLSQKDVVNVSDEKCNLLWFRSR